MRHKSDQNAQKYKARCDPTFVNFHKSMEKYKARCDRGAAHESRHLREVGMPSRNTLDGRGVGLKFRIQGRRLVGRNRALA